MFVQRPYIWLLWQVRTKYIQRESNHPLPQNLCAPKRDFNMNFSLAVLVHISTGATPSFPPKDEWEETTPVGGAELAWWAWLVMEVGVAAVIVIGDVSLLMLFFTRKLLGQSTNILVFSIAVADLMTGLFVLPLDVMQVRASTCL